MSNAFFLIILSLNAQFNLNTTETNLITENNNFYSLHSSNSSSFNFNNLDTWNLEMVNAFEAQKITNGSKEVIIAVIDTGIDYSYPDFNDHLWINEDEIIGNGIDDDNNDYVDDINGWDFHYNDSVPDDLIGHGTFIASLILGLTNESSPEVKVPGIAPNISLMIIKFFGDEDASTHEAHFIQSIRYAVKNGANIISLSIRATNPSPYILDTIEWAYNQGVIIVGTTGNDADLLPNYVSYLGRHSSVIATGALDIYSNKAHFSQYGPEIEIAAPGHEVYGSFLFNDSLNSKITVNSQLITSDAFVDSILGNITSELVYANLGYIDDYNDINVIDKIVLVDRGGINFTFQEKMLNAYSEGASGIIVANNLEGEFLGTFNGTSFIPGSTISLENGNMIKSWLYEGTVATNLFIYNTNVSKGSGTSFACPLVSATAALMLSHNPELNNSLARTILKQTATDINMTGWDKFTGYGLLNSKLAVKAVIDKELPEVIVNIKSFSDKIEIVINTTDNLGIYSIETKVEYETSSTRHDTKIYQGGQDKVHFILIFDNKNKDNINVQIIIKDIAGNCYFFYEEGFEPSKNSISFTIVDISSLLLVFIVIKRKRRNFT